MTHFASTTDTDHNQVREGAAMLPAGLEVSIFTDYPTTMEAPRQGIRLEAPETPLPAYSIFREPQGGLTVSAVYGECPGHERLDDLGEFATMPDVLIGVLGHLREFQAMSVGVIHA